MAGIAVEARSVIFSEPDQVVLARDMVPEPATGQVRIKTTKSLVSTGTELTCLRAAFEPDSRWSSWVKFPFRPGYSAVGVIVDLGPSTDGWKIGDRVAVRGGHSEYINWPPQAPAGQTRAKPWRFTRSEINLIHSMLLVPKGVADQDATWFGLSSIAQLAVRRCSPALGDAVVVIGCGPLGQMIVRWARQCGPRRLIAIDSSSSRLALARRGGATDVVPMKAAQARDAIFDLTDGIGADAVYDVTGRADVLTTAIELTKRLGTIVLVGDTPITTSQHISGELIAKGAKIIGVHDLVCPSSSTEYSFWTHEKMVQLFFEQCLRGEFDLTGLITRIENPTNAAELYECLKQSQDEMGVIFDWENI